MPSLSLLPSLKGGLVTHSPTRPFFFIQKKPSDQVTGGPTARRFAMSDWREPIKRNNKIIACLLCVE